MLLLRQVGIEPVVHICTSGADPARHATRAREQHAELVVAIGGDGLVAAVAEGLLGNGAAIAGSRPAMAVVPTGSANDYARALGVRSLPLNDHVRLMADATARADVDVIKVATDGAVRHILNVGGTGFDAVVAGRAMRIHRLRGAPRYVTAMLAELPRFRGASFRLTLDGEQHDTRAMMVAVANGSTYGGGMKVVPQAHLQSGWLDICVIGQLSRVAFLRAFPRVFRGTHTTHPAVTMLRGREVHVSADQPLGILGDGELLGELPATFTVMPRALRVVAPRDARLA